MDLLSLYHVGNEGTINVLGKQIICNAVRSLIILERYFEMSKPDAERALGIYKTFSKQTDQVVAFLSVARQFENATRLEIPKLKHAPTSLTSSLEEYLNDPDFEINRRQYLAQKEAKKSGKLTSPSKEPSSEFSKLNLNGGSSKAFPEAKPSQATSSRPEVRGPAPDLIDFFESIEQKQQPMVSQPQQQFSNAQPIPQYQFQQQQFQNPQAQLPQATNQVFGNTNPFASMVTPSQGQAPLQADFASFTGQPQTQNSQFSPNAVVSQNPTSPYQQQPFFTGQPQPFSNGILQQPQQGPFANGPPPFAQNTTQPSLPSLNSGGFQPMATGQQSTNPFRQSMMPQATPSSTQSFMTASPTQNQNPQSTNPFNAFPPQQTQNGASPFTSAPPSSASSFFSANTLQSPQSVQSMPPAQPLQPTRTGTNPFRSAPGSTSQTPMTSPLAPQKTGTNPFRQSTFVNQQTGQSWVNNQGTMGGLEKLDTIPIFPRPTGQ